MIAFGLSISVNLDASDLPALMIPQWAGAPGLVTLVFRRFRTRAFGIGYQDLFSSLRPLLEPFAGRWMREIRNASVMGLLYPRTPAGAGVALFPVAARSC